VGQLKAVELANLPGATLVEVADQAQRGIERVCASDDLVVGFLAHTGLALDDQPSTKPAKLNKINKTTEWDQPFVDGLAVLHLVVPCSPGFAAERATDDDRVEATPQTGMPYL